MTYKEKTTRLAYLLHLLDKKQIKNPLDISTKLNCSEKTARRMLNYLREEGHKIYYSKQCKSYLLTK